jgi:hypothetical protein
MTTRRRRITAMHSGIPARTREKAGRQAPPVATPPTSPSHASFIAAAPRLIPKNPTPLHHSACDFLAIIAQHQSSESPILRFLARLSKGCRRVVGKPCRTFFGAAHEPPDGVEFATISISQKIFFAALLTRVEKMFAARIPKKSRARPMQKKKMLWLRARTLDAPHHVCPAAENRT